jgi:hypothetical protein
MSDDTLPLGSADGAPQATPPVATVDGPTVAQDLGSEPVTLEFTKMALPYNDGDTATFSPTQAQRYLDAKVAVRAKGQGKPGAGAKPTKTR